MAVAGLFFGACAIFMSWMASTNDRGLVLNGLLEFGPQGASVFFWMVAALSFLFVLAAAWIIFSSLVHGIPDVVLGAETISFPRGFPVKRVFALRYAEITGLSRSDVNGQRFLTLHTSGKKHHIALNWLGSKEAEARLENELAKRVG
jgi:hypothetical protein